VEEIFAALASSDVAAAFRRSRWLYAAANTTHIIGIALLVGAILPLDLRFLGVWKTVPRAGLIRVLVPVAGTGLAIAIGAGLLLFSARAPEYAMHPIFQIKLILIALGAGSAVAIHLFHGLWLDRADDARLARVGALSMTCWLGALVAGRMIAFVDT
jgi:hypothetical protein